MNRPSFFVMLVLLVLVILGTAIRSALAVRPLMNQGFADVERTQIP